MEVKVANNLDGMKIVITDVSVFFDLYCLQILPEFFDLDLEIYTTNFVFNEITQIEQISEFNNFERVKKLRIINISVEEEVVIRQFKLYNANKSFPDISMLWKALQLNCTLLTCDNKLRKEAELHGITVHGSIWVILQLAENDIINKEKAINLLEKMKLVNTRLPIEEVEKQIKKLE
jgi:predicted nucleic acid-binding protein